MKTRSLEHLESLQVEDLDKIQEHSYRGGSFRDYMEDKCKFFSDHVLHNNSLLPLQVALVLFICFQGVRLHLANKQAKILDNYSSKLTKLKKSCQGLSIDQDHDLSPSKFTVNQPVPSLNSQLGLQPNAYADIQQKLDEVTGRVDAYSKRIEDIVFNQNQDRLHLTKRANKIDGDIRQMAFLQETMLEHTKGVSEAYVKIEAEQIEKIKYVNENIDVLGSYGYDLMVGSDQTKRDAINTLKDTENLMNSVKIKSKLSADELPKYQGEDWGKEDHLNTQGLHINPFPTPIQNNHNHSWGKPPENRENCFKEKPPELGRSYAPSCDGYVRRSPLNNSNYDGYGPSREPVVKLKIDPPPDSISTSILNVASNLGGRAIENVTYRMAAYKGNQDPHDVIQKNAPWQSMLYNKFGFLPPGTEFSQLMKIRKNSLATQEYAKFIRPAIKSHKEWRAQKQKEKLEGIMTPFEAAFNDYVKERGTDRSIVKDEIWQEHEANLNVIIPENYRKKFDIVVQEEHKALGGFPSERVYFEWFFFYWDKANVPYNKEAFETYKKMVFDKYFSKYTEHLSSTTPLEEERSPAIGTASEEAPKFTSEPKAPWYKKFVGLKKKKTA